MKTDIIVIDDFYNNPDEVRAFALAQEFNIEGNYPGYRTRNFLNESTKKAIQDILFPFSGKVTDWLDDHDTGCCGSFQITLACQKTWIHNDGNNDWGGVLYLTPDAPVIGGTGFFRSKIDGTLRGTRHDLPGQDKSKWDLVAEVGNIYNRLVLFRADQWHSSLEYFGQDNEDGRLTQVFFVKTEK
jgi:hypothetical protein